ncbi:Ferredoxin-1 [Tetrabaena socialis]|uniref:Ferredoxin-1 n=1 Tax=Tetrabaena socialis TaxID=47790 RepID=A0A2J8A381_9CHLO|nr:Ferredoxin-1 [Tetrabaena socialis]|eukprot:PNH06958.1 Ferredoxin-1 [Tetrabaena socialis]
MGRRPWRSARVGHGSSSRRGLLPLRAATTAAPQQQQQEEGEYIEEDFYSLLGVSPVADGREIKRAYYSMMRTCHPDRSGDNESTNFCALLNEIYETLMDPARRELYDQLAGFSEESINPFLDDRYPVDRAFVDEFSCIGCRNCNSVCPKTFSMEEDYGRARVMQQDVDTEEKIQEAMDTCPVSCIHWVTSPQLSLLESAMVRMERVAVFGMMGGAGANKDVFTEASLAWTRRQSDIRARLQAASSSSRSGWSFWDSSNVSFGGSTGSRVYSEADKAKQQREQQRAAGGGDRESRGVAELAARAARAARTWRSYQDVTAAARRERMVLTSFSSASSMDD